MKLFDAVTLSVAHRGMVMERDSRNRRRANAKETVKGRRIAREARGRNGRMGKGGRSEGCRKKQGLKKGIKGREGEGRFSRGLREPDVVSDRH